MRKALVLFPLSTLFLSTAALRADGSCSMSRGDDAQSFEHVYAVRVADSNPQLTVLCLPEAASEADLTTAMSKVLPVDSEVGGLMVEIDPEMGPVFSVVAWGGRSHQYSGTIWDVAFDGNEEGGRVRGRIETTQPLTFDEEKAGWTFVIDVDTEILDLSPEE